MWICNKCETYNNDTDAFCCICNAPKMGEVFINNKQQGGFNASMNEEVQEAPPMGFTTPSSPLIDTSDYNTAGIGKPTELADPVSSYPPPSAPFTPPPPPPAERKKMPPPYIPSDSGRSTARAFPMNFDAEDIMRKRIDAVLIAVNVVLALVNIVGMYKLLN